MLDFETSFYWNIFTFDVEDPISQGSGDLQESLFGGHVEIIFICRIAGYRLDFLDKLFAVDVIPYVVPEHL